MGDERSGGASFQLPTALIVAAIVGALFYPHTPFKTSRSPDKPLAIHVATEDQQADARLWQDPLEAVRLAQEHEKEAAEKPVDGAVAVETVVTNLVVNVGSGATSATLAIKATVGKKTPEQTSALRRLLPPPPREGTNLVLGIMMRGAPFAGDAETRVRTRYAVLSALGVAGYVPKDHLHLGYAAIPWPTRNRLELASNGFTKLTDYMAGTPADEKSGWTQLVIPFESFETNSLPNALQLQTNDPGKVSFGTIQVLWLNDEAFKDDPVLRLALLVGACTNISTNQNTCFRILGPQDSGTLRKMLPGWRSQHGLTNVADKSKLRSVLADNDVRLYLSRPKAVDWLLTGDTARSPAFRRVLTAGVSSVFSSGEFVDSFTTTGLIEALQANQVEIPKATTPIESLNALLNGPPLHLHEKFKEVHLSDEAKYLARRLSSWEFFADEFGGSFTVSELCKAIRSHGVTVPAARTSIESLNALLDDGRLFEKYEKVPLGKEAKKIVEQASAPNLDNHFKRNRCFIEAAYPGECPKRQVKESDCVKLNRLILEAAYPENCPKKADAELKRHFADVVNTTCTDDELADVLYHELARRGVSRTSGDRVAFVSEWDTFYGRSQTEAFTNLWIGLPMAQFSYLAGLDGMLPGDTDAQHRTGKEATDKKRQEPRQLIEDMEKPEGRSQLDYIRRIAAKIEQINQTPTNQIKAIGVVGGDVYDKLLVLQALHERLPGMIFFTTTLDARLCHPSQLPWTRNLIVASAFGLELSDKYQRSIPPFRDSNQTADYLATLCAAGMKTDALACLAPRLFEIGHNGPYDISLRCDSNHTNSSDCLFPARSGGSESAWSLLSGLVLKNIILPVGLIVLLLSLVAPVRAKLAHLWAATRSDPKPDSVERFFVKLSKQRLNCYLGILGAAVVSFSFLGGVICMDYNRWHLGEWKVGEPFSLTEGISLWPTEIIRMTVFFLGVFFYVRAKYGSLSSDIAMADKYYSKPARADVIEAKPWWQSLRQRSHRIGVLSVLLVLVPSIWCRFGFSLFPGGWGWLECVCIAALIIVLLCVNFYVVDTTRLPRMWQGVRLWYDRHSITAWSLEYSRMREQQRHSSTSTQPFTVEATKLWAKFIRLGHPSSRWQRVFVQVLVFGLFAGGVMWGLGFPNSPYRGDWSKWCDVLVLIFSVLMLLWVNFYVVDATRLVRSLIDNLALGATEWPAETERRFAQKRGMDRRDMADWIDIKFIGERTSVEGRLIIYPFILLILMMLARSPYLDNFNWPRSLVIVFAINAVLAISSAVRLQRTARTARERAIASLNEKLVQLGNESSVRAAQFRQTIEDIRNYREGAFRPLAEHPLCHAWLLFGGSGLIGLLQYLSPFR